MAFLQGSAWSGTGPGEVCSSGHGPGGEGEDTGGQCLAWRTGKGSASPAARSPRGVDSERDQAVTWEVEPRWREEHLLEGGSEEAQGPRWEAQGPPGSSFSSQGKVRTGTRYGRLWKWCCKVRLLAPNGHTSPPGELLKVQIPIQRV